jgi:transposase-like protein
MAMSRGRARSRAASSKDSERWTSEQARAVLERQRGSRLSVWAFARREGYSAERLYRWRRRLAEGSRATPVRLVELIATTPNGAGTALEVATAAGVARLAGRFGVAELAALVRELQRPC